MRKRTASFAAIGAVVPESTPAGRAMHTTHIGDYGALRHAHAAVLAWGASQGRAFAGLSWEVYGHWHADPAQLRTDVYHLLA